MESLWSKTLQKQQLTVVPAGNNYSTSQTNLLTTGVYNEPHHAPQFPAANVDNFRPRTFGADSRTIAAAPANPNKNSVSNAGLVNAAAISNVKIARWQLAVTAALGCVVVLVALQPPLVQNTAESGEQKSEGTLNLFKVAMVSAAAAGGVYVLA